MYPVFGYKARAVVFALLLCVFSPVFASAQTVTWIECYRVEFPVGASVLIPKNWCAKKDGKETVNGGVIGGWLFADIKKPGEAERYGFSDSFGSFATAGAAFYHIGGNNSQDAVSRMTSSELAQFAVDLGAWVESDGFKVSRWIETNKQKFGSAWGIVAECEFVPAGKTQSHIGKFVHVYGGADSFGMFFHYVTDSAGENKQLIDGMVKSLRSGVPVTESNATGMIEVGRAAADVEQSPRAEASKKYVPTAAQRAETDALIRAAEKLSEESKKSVAKAKERIAKEEAAEERQKEQAAALEREWRAQDARREAMREFVIESFTQFGVSLLLLLFFLPSRITDVKRSGKWNVVKTAYDLLPRGTFFWSLFWRLCKVAGVLKLFLIGAMSPPGGNPVIGVLFAVPFIFAVPVGIVRRFTRFAKGESLWDSYFSSIGNIFGVGGVTFLPGSLAAMVLSGSATLYCYKDVARAKKKLPPVPGNIANPASSRMSAAMPVLLCGIIGAVVLCFASWYITESEKQKLLAAGGDRDVVRARAEAIGIRDFGKSYKANYSEYEERLRERMLWCGFGGFLLGSAAGFLVTRRRGDAEKI